MRPKWSIQDFIFKAKEKHGQKYDYSRCEYVNIKTKVEIICPIHGLFEQTPENHIKHGCGKCANDSLANKAIEKLKDKRFGTLVVKDVVSQRDGDRKVRKAVCDCDCGKINILMFVDNLKRVKSCGCLKGKSQIEDLTNQKFSKLTAVKVEKTKSGKLKWFCVCECGGNIKTDPFKLKIGETKSCGCLRKRRGSEHPNWKPLEDESLRLQERGSVRNPLNEEWRRNVYERDNYTCQITGERGGKLVAHHLFNWADYKDLRFEISNGVTLCERVHKLFHKIYGKKKNTKDQFEEFKVNYKMSFLFLDDTRIPKDAWLYDEEIYLTEASGIPRGSWDIVRSYDDFKKYILERGVPKVISWDFDLNRGHMQYYMHHFNAGTWDIDDLEYTGYHCLKWLINHCKETGAEFPQSHVHSANCWGRALIKKTIEEYGNQS